MVIRRKFLQSPVLDGSAAGEVVDCLPGAVREAEQLVRGVVEKAANAGGANAGCLRLQIKHLADAAYHAKDKIFRPLRALGIIPMIAERNREHGSGLGQYRYVVEACFDWLFNWRRLRVRYEKRPDIHDGFLALACAMICWKKLQAA